MTDKPYNLAIDMSGLHGSISLGHSDKLLATRLLPDPRQPPRHRIDLIPTIDRLCQEHTVTPRQLGQVYVSVGPGSFTGLRISIATAKTLGRVLAAKLVPVPTIDAWAYHAWSSHRGCGVLAVCLNIKKDSVYAGLYDVLDGEYQVIQEPVVVSLAAFLESAPRPLTVMGDRALPPFTEIDDNHVTTWQLDPTTTLSESVWHQGRAAAWNEEFINPLQLEPLYVRPPEAQQLWQQRHQTVRT